VRQGLHGLGYNPCADARPLSSPPAMEALCYPRWAGWCKDLISELDAAGVEGVCTGYRRPGFPPGVLGRGHSSIVVLVRGRGMLLAAKARRTDSRRHTLILEAATAARAAFHGAAPHVYYASDNLILMEYLEGRLLGSLRRHPSYPQAVIAALDAARALDTAGIIHRELTRPWKHVIYNGVHARIIDYDSAGRGCGNPVKLASGVLSGLPGGLELLRRYRGLMRRYRDECSYEVYEKLRLVVWKVLEELYGG